MLFSLPPQRTNPPRKRRFVAASRHSGWPESTVAPADGSRL
jgi:hypothetical protein